MFKISDLTNQELYAATKMILLDIEESDSSEEEWYRKEMEKRLRAFRTEARRRFNGKK